LMYWDRGANVASAASIVLGDDGNNFVITGTATVTIITAKPDGTVVLLRFSSTAKVRTGENISLNGGPFNGRAGALLALVSDGTTWYEIARAGALPHSCQLRLSADTTIADDGSDNALAWDGTHDWNFGPLWASGSNTRITPGAPGIYDVWFIVPWDTNTTGRRRVRLHKNGSLFQELDVLDCGDIAEYDITQAGMFRAVVALATDYFELRLTQNSGGSRTVQGGSGKALFGMGWYGPAS
jgi:hypothetical protein